VAITIEVSTLPYPGLRPFRDDESDIFFGREAQIDQLLVRLSRNHFLAVTGPSGCGKSSLIKAGMIPALSAGFMIEGGSRWRICELRPGDRPLARLAGKMASAEILGADRTDLESIAYIEATLRRGPLGLIEIVRGSETLAGANLLVMIDQFEEIFRYRDRIAADEADAFVALLLASARQTEVAIYVVITMRSDYLGDCALFHGLPETVSDAQYLTPRLIRHDLELAIDAPARVFGGRVEPRLVNRLINDFGTAPDQ
jgi:energy-coupling factor transporter ATP-binding protein EcfA2